MYRRKSIVLTGVLAVVVAVAGYGYYFHHTCLPHFRTVRKRVLYRSGQPRGPGLHALRLWGIRTIVNLRGEDGGGIPEERAFAAEHGIAFQAIPVGGTHEAIAEAVDRFLAIVDREENWPVLVHCSRGKERAGVLAATFRVQYDKWPSQQALYELYRYGLTPGSMPVAEEFVWDFASRRGGAIARRNDVTDVSQEVA